MRIARTRTHPLPHKTFFSEQLRAVQARKRARAERGTYSELRKLRKGLDAATAARAAAVEERRARKAARLAKEGVKGQRIGKHIVPEGRVDVQLGEELSESLRALKVRLDEWPSSVLSSSPLEEVRH